MSLLEQPQAQALLADAVVRPAAVRGCQEHLTQFLRRYLPLFYRKEQRDLATVVIQGRLSGLERKTSEPIAIQAGRHRKPVQHFVGAGAWDDETVTAELRCHVAEELGDPQAVFIVDGSGFAKKGTASCGVARRPCRTAGSPQTTSSAVARNFGANCGDGTSVTCWTCRPTPWCVKWLRGVTAKNQPTSVWSSGQRVSRRRVGRR